MLRITVQQQVEPVTLLLEGKLAGPWVDELRAAWSSVRSSIREQRALIVLSELSSVDADGRSLLADIHSGGGVLVGSGLLARALIQEIAEPAS